MIDFANLPEYRTELPQRSFLGTYKDAMALSGRAPGAASFFEPGSNYLYSDLFKQLAHV
jgi:hypothetical protein